jgi:uncharacterized phage-associated protein
MGQDTGAALYGLRERNSMARVRDVAAYIISNLRSVDVMKLQKLLYAWSLVVQKAFKTYQGQYKVSSALEGDKTFLSEDERGTVHAILRFNGDKEGFYLSELTHKEEPWMDARKGLAPGDKSDREITKASMRDYYSSLG